ncbi:MAG: septum formation initiator family protein [Bacteroidales bacterium]|nr:septum formation initiator family protein [Bacteroidales bacterium]
MKKLWNNIKNAVSAFLQWRYRNYVIVVLLFLLWFLLLAPNDLNTQYHIIKERKAQRELKRFYEKEIQRYEEEIHKFRNDPDFVETYAREEYLMKRDNEDIFLIIE